MLLRQRFLRNSFIEFCKWLFSLSVSVHAYARDKLKFVGRFGGSKQLNQMSAILMWRKIVGPEFDDLCDQSISHRKE